ncbi:MAG: hypothetical protein ACFCVE_05190 [Phycisphaerae bacterium]
MPDWIQQTIDVLQALPPEDRGNVTLALTLQFVLTMVYYLVAGLVAWALGKRIIQATFAAMREVQRDRA